MLPACERLLGRYSMSPNVSIAVRTVLAATLALLAMSSPASANGPSDPAVPYVQPMPFACCAGAFTRNLATAPLDPDSTAYVSDLVARVQKYGAFIDRGTDAIFQTTSAPSPITPVYLQHTRTPDYPVFAAGIPMPANAAPGNAPTDSTMSVYDPISHELWHMWRVSTPTQNAVGCTQPLPWGQPCWGDGHWHAVIGSRIGSVVFSPGYFDYQSDPGVGTTDGGSSATSTVNAARTVLASEVIQGHIDHAVAISLGVAANCSGVNSWPAQRNDGSDTTPPPGCVPEGTFFRLDPALALCDAQAGTCPPGTTALPHFTYLVAKAAQTYGMCDCESSHGGASLQDENTTQYGYDAWTPTGLLDGYYAWNAMTYFPWSRLQAVATSLRSHSATRATSTTTVTPATGLNISVGDTVAFEVNVATSDGRPPLGFVYLNQNGLNGQGNHVQVRPARAALTMTKAFQHLGTFKMTVAYGGDETVKPSQSQTITVSVT